MKASGEYDPITQKAGGSYEVSRSDYQERRSDWIFWLIAGIAIIVVIWYVIKDTIKTAATVIPDPIKAASDWAAGAINAPGDLADKTARAIQTANQNSIDTVVRAKGGTPGPAATEAYWDAAARYLGEGAIQSTAISAGNVILSTPVINNLGQPLLAQATVSGENFKQALDTYGDTERLENDPLRGLIVTGEGLSRTFTGFSPYEAGKAFGGWISGRGSV